MEALDCRHLAKQRADGAMFPKKGRVEGSPSESFPPPGAPGWALDKEWCRQHPTSPDNVDGEAMYPFYCSGTTTPLQCKECHPPLCTGSPSTDCL